MTRALPGSKPVIRILVNNAARIESATRDAQAGLLFSEAVYQQIQPEVVAGRIIDAVLKGKPGRHPLYEVLDLAACPKG